MALAMSRFAVGLSACQEAPSSRRGWLALLWVVAVSLSSVRHHAQTTL